MSQFSTFKSILLAGAALTFAACTQGSDIESPGAPNPGTPPGGGGGGGGGGVVSGDTCPSGFAAGTVIDRPSGADQVVCTISGTFLTNIALPYKDDDGDGIPVAYQISGRVNIGEDVGADGTGGDAASITIQPGVTLFGESGSDFIVVNRGSQILADGTETQPIVFTSRADLEGTQADPTNAIGEWGGLVILGRAPINRCEGGGTPGMADCENVIEGVTAPEAQYGGGLATDNSGILRYVRVQFAGFPLSSGNELNGISFGGVGSDTIVDYVQVHNNSDDGIEMFGGTVNLKHIVLTGNDDDSLDTDNGWNGKVQFLVVKQVADRGDNGFEMSSAGTTVSPATNPTIANFTIVGSTKATDPGNGIRINSGHVGRFLNGVVQDQDECFRWQDAGDGNATFDGIGTDPAFNSVLFDCGAGGLTIDDPETPAAVASVAADPNNSEDTSSITTNFQAGAKELPPMATPFAVETLDPFFVEADYLGAFGPDETETNNWATGWTFALFEDPGCPDGTSDTGNTINGVRVCLLAGNFDGDPVMGTPSYTEVNLTRGNYYELDGRVDIGVDVGYDGLNADGQPIALNIEPGVSIFGNSGSDFMVINRGSQIFSNGTRQNPVVMTSEADLLDNVSPALRLDSIGEWGGLVILGRAPINRCATGSILGGDCQNVIEGVTAPEAEYGGNLATDNSGVLMYTLVKFAGFPLSSGNELNGISFGGVGSGTVVEYVQVHNNSDDGIEMFGGTVDLKHIVLTGNDDDSLDTDNGWDGNVQFLIVKQRDGRGDNGFEMSSAGTTVSPATNPTIANFTILGTTKATDPGNGMRINSGHIGRFINGIVVDEDACFRWQDAGDGNATYDGLNVDPTFENTILDCAGGLERSDPDAAAAVAAIAAQPSTSTTTDVNLISGFINDTAADGFTAFTDLPTNVDAFFEDVDYVGAVENSSDLWWDEWSCGLVSDDC
ncbi:hypothetical protein [Hyphococcus sp.]|uniref:hypothetical protein n=1 Tax=Hyphococcus sp. TaxID=2038636 RepID=UPI003D0AF08B